MSSSATPKKSPTRGSKSVKPQHRTPKRTSSAVSIHPYNHLSQAADMNGRHKRVWKACERCRMKKTKCDGEFPCKRCKDDGLVCTAGTRKKVEFKQLPRGYAKVLENTQFALITTVHKLYKMVRPGKQWTLREPEINDRGLPVIHEVASKLGAIRPNSDIDLPVHSVFPGDEASMAELARQLEEQQQQQQQSVPGQDISVLMSRKDSDSATLSSMSPAVERSDDGELNLNHRRMALGSINTGMSPPANLTHSADFDNARASDFGISNFDMFTSQTVPNSDVAYTPPMWLEIMPQQQEKMQQLVEYNRKRIMQGQHLQQQQKQQRHSQGLQGFGMKPQALSQPN